MSFREAAQLHEMWRAGLSAAEAVKTNLKCIRFHCEAFGIGPEVRESAAFNGFEDVVRAAGTGVVESSVKVAGLSVSPARFNVFCSPRDTHAFLNAMVRFVEDVARTDSATLNVRPVVQMLGGADLSTVRRMVCGIDLRPNYTQSRLKIWVIADHEPGNPANPVERMLAGAEVDARFLPLHVHNSLLMGYDLHFDGATALKVYPDVWEQELEISSVRERFASVLSQQSMQGTREAYWTHVYLSSRCRLDMHLKDPDSFVKNRLRNPLADRVHAAYQGVPMLDVVAAVTEDELAKHQVEEFTLYYMPARVSG